MMAQLDEPMRREHRTRSEFIREALRHYLGSRGGEQLKAQLPLNLSIYLA